MIALTRLDKQTMFLNPDHIISIEETPDTVITLFNGNRYIVVEHASTIISRIVAFRSRVARRAAGAQGKKYLVRQHRELFKQVAIDPEAICHATAGSHDRIPLHSRDF